MEKDPDSFHRVFTAITADEPQPEDVAIRSQVNAANEPAVPTVAGYQISGLLGAGGMGTVWRARQRGTDRDVALKLLSDRRDDPKARARFIREVELACRLEHPHIARVYESGVHQGHFYYAMELVDGVTLDAYVRERKLDTTAILQLMQTVCDAVQHAHFKGVIHRDLKPSNIMVTASGQPRVLDFGLARPIIEAREAVLTEEGSGWSGTPAYMSPEQAAGSAALIDTRSDVYSLGKILYELLVGQPAHDLSGSRHDLWRRVIEEDVRRPRLQKPALHHDLEAILLKALSRDSGSRYGSAEALGRDLYNVLHNEPITARPATITYFLGKKLKRHRAAVTAAGGVVLLLAGMAIVSYARIAHERNVAVVERTRADNERAVANAARLTAQQEAANANAINHFFQRVLDALNPKNARGVNNVGREMMDRADQALKERFAGDPRTEASIRVALGRNMLALGQFATAETQLTRAVDLMTASLPAGAGASPDTLAAMDLLAQAHRERGNISAAAALAQRAFEQCKTTYGEKDPRTLSSMNTFAYVLDDLGRRDDAENICRSALALAGDIQTPSGLAGAQVNPFALTLASTLTRMLRDSHDPTKLTEAEAWARQVCISRRSPWKDALPTTLLSAPDDPPTPVVNDPELLEAMHDLASVLTVRAAADPVHGHWDEALTLHRYVVQRGLDVLGADHPDLIIWRNDLAAALMMPSPRQNLAEAEAIYREILPAATEVRGSEHRYTVIILRMLAEVTRQQGKIAEARFYCQQVEIYATRAADRVTREFGQGNAQELPFLDALAAALCYQRKYSEAERAYLRALETRRTLFGPDHRDTLFNALSLAQLYRIWEKPDKAREILRKTQADSQRALGDDDPFTRSVQQELDSLPQVR